MKYPWPETPGICAGFHEYGVGGTRVARGGTSGWVSAVALGYPPTRADKVNGDLLNTAWRYTMSTIKMTPELAAYLALPESEKKALAQAIKAEKGVFILNQGNVEALASKVKLPANAVLSHYVSTKGPRTMQLIVKHSDRQSTYFKLAGGKHSDNQEVANVDVQANINKWLAQNEAEKAALVAIKGLLETK